MRNIDEYYLEEYLNLDLNTLIDRNTLFDIKLERDEDIHICLEQEDIE